ncbi:hypothetical protein CBS147323_11136 [Aspergillus niger]|nr:hypothetical protein CBS147323_11136 [Aspergillus niger]
MFVEYAVSAHGDMDWSPESFDCLQIPSDDKTLLLSLAKTRPGLIPTVPFDDVIDGKGQGLTILRNALLFLIEANAVMEQRTSYQLTIVL